MSINKHNGVTIPKKKKEGSNIILYNIGKRKQDVTASHLRRLPSHYLLLSEVQTCNKYPHLLFVVGLSLFSEQRSFCFLCIVKEDNLLVS